MNKEKMITAEPLMLLETVTIDDCGIVPPKRVKRKKRKSISTDSQMTYFDWKVETRTNKIARALDNHLMEISGGEPLNGIDIYSDEEECFPFLTSDMFDW